MVFFPYSLHYCILFAMILFVHIVKVYNNLNTTDLLINLFI